MIRVQGVTPSPLSPRLSLSSPQPLPALPCPPQVWTVMSPCTPSSQPHRTSQRQGVGSRANILPRGFNTISFKTSCILDDPPPKPMIKGFDFLDCSLSNP